ncbi:MAG: hypothetical protein IKT63_00755, partial [Oscillospiraceae bacterium]|nr:hypothetical protein [Oscillospiraceae bacterium]
MKKIYAVIIAAAMLLSFCLGVGASNGLEEINALLNRGITIKMDGQAQEMYDANGQRVYPISYNGTTYLPVRAVSNMLGLGVAWDEAANSVLLTSGGAVSTSKTLAAGATVGDTYINEFIGIGFKLPTGWRFATDEEIEALTAGGALLVGENLEDRMAKTGFFCDMIAQSEEGEFVVLTIEKKTELAKILGFEEAFNFSMEYTKEQLTSDVYKDITLTPRDIQIGNLVCKGYDIEGTV